MEFLFNARLEQETEEPSARVKHNREFVRPVGNDAARRESTRCMQCGTPFCRAACPLGNDIPGCHADLDAGRWRDAYERLRQTNPFPEFTGRICPAPCESACTLGLIRDPVAIETLEKTVAEKAAQEGWLAPRAPLRRRSEHVAIVGSGPAGLAAAYELNQRGFYTTVFERSQHLGGLLQNGVPNFKLEKSIVQKRIEVLRAEGVRFESGLSVGTDIEPDELFARYSALLLAIGATSPRRPDFLKEGFRSQPDVIWADDYLTEHTRSLAAASSDNTSKDKVVAILGGGDTGSDCVGTAHRQGARQVIQIEITSEKDHTPIFPRLNQPTSMRHWPETIKNHMPTTSQEEGGQVFWQTNVRRLVRNRHGALVGLEVIKNGFVDFIPCQLLVVAIGYDGAERQGLLEKLRVAIDSRGRVITDDPTSYRTSRKRVYAAGDMVRGASLVVNAIADGIKAAKQIADDIDRSKGWRFQGRCSL